MKSYKAKETLQLGLSKRYTVTLHTGHIVTVLRFYLIFPSHELLLDLQEPPLSLDFSVAWLLSFPLPSR